MEINEIENSDIVLLFCGYRMIRLSNIYFIYFFLKL
uniref:Uncharacterized protein n=1 Tax=Heterorhabditis bacteriophora TaxID=37862 RepID=A0A1I7X3P4_HETBA